MHTLEFSYKKVVGGFAPIIPVTLAGRGDSVSVECYVDSGAVMSLFDNSSAELLGIDWRSGKKRPFVVGDGKLIYGFVSNLHLTLGDLSFAAPIAFSAELKIGFNLLGRSGIFTQFSEIAFQERRHKLVFRV